MTASSGRERGLERWMRLGTLILVVAAMGLGWLALKREAALVPPGLELRLVAAERVLWARPWREADLTPLSYTPGVPARPWRAELHGFWAVPARGRYRFTIKSDGLFLLRVCGQEVLARGAANRDPRLDGEVALSEGICPIEVQYTPVGSETMLRLRAGYEGERPSPLDANRLYSAATALAEASQRAVLLRLRQMAVGALISSLPLGCFALVLARRRAGVWPRGLVVVALLSALTLLAGALRFEALVGQYWLQDAPGWAWRLRETVESLRPWTAAWNPRRFAYGGDPARYLDFARESYRFYDAHVREPVFIFATRGLLRVVGDQPIAVNLAAMLFSVLTIPAVFLLGRVAFGTGTGLTAAGLLAVEQHVISNSVDGWRDEAFTFFAVAAAAALVWLCRRGHVRAGILVGVLGGLACLTRITALSFLLPGLLLAALGASAPGRRARLLAVGVAFALMVAIVSPFLIPCWVTYDDPFISINAHTRFYRARQGVADFKQHQSWGGYLASMHTPLGLLDKGLTGLTVHPFCNKWDGFGPLWAAAPLLPWLAVLGMSGFLFLVDGRRLLVLLFASLIPYAFTWDVSGGGEWRFTEHAYPFYLIAVGCVVTALARRSFWQNAFGQRYRTVARVAAVLGAWVLLWLVLRGVHRAQVLSELRAGKTTRILAGPQDGLIFGGGWSRARYENGSWRRGAQKREASLTLPLPPGRAYGLRLSGRDLCGGSGVALGVKIGGRPVGTVLLSDAHGPARAPLRLPVPLSAHGPSTVTLVAPPCDADVPFELTRVEIVPL
jgi:hypothetical protein